MLYSLLIGMSRKDEEGIKLAEWIDSSTTLDGCFR